MDPGLRLRTSLEEIGTVEIFSDKSAVQDVVSVSSSSGGDTDRLESLCKRLLRTQPQSGGAVEAAARAVAAGGRPTRLCRY